MTPPTRKTPLPSSYPPPWQTGGSAWRTAPLPKDWAVLRRAVLGRDKRCMWPEPTPCGGPLEVDHVGNNADHSLNNLRALCKNHHRTRTARQANAARLAKRKLHTKARPKRKHPGLI